MTLFIDTSSLFKLYHNELGTVELDTIFSENEITRVFISEITNVEFVSAVFNKVRMKELTIDNAEKIINLFDTDLKKYTIIPVEGSTLL